MDSKSLTRPSSSMEAQKKPSSSLKTKAPSATFSSGTDQPQQPQSRIPATWFLKGEDIGLPQGWLIEQRPRMSVKYFGKIDQAVVDQMKSEGTPLPHQTTEKNQENALTVVAPASALKVSKAKNKLIGEISVNFQPPENSLVNYINLDKAKKRASSSTASKRRRKQSSNVASSSGKKSEIEIVEEEILGNDELDKFIEEMADKLSKYPFDVKEKLKIHDGEEPGARINRLMDETIEITRFLSGSGSIPEMKEDDKGKTSLTFASFSSPMMKGDNIIEEQTEALQNDNPMMKEKEEITDEQIEMLLNDGDRLSSLLRSLEDIMDTEDSNEEVSSKFL
ncbi:hypothetical protein O6P43_026522 [Quillaja saponaria]|uniref:Uncharacterized protein n=1 Tax=Quillaja saponaria TaxID=32244 RepID=A0AAD7L2C6_QUISA|nr:hypothetical protein O6P43_026522 [Quillaja saponaria]